jgi:hypothetical protein
MSIYPLVETNIFTCIGAATYLEIIKSDAHQIVLPWLIADHNEDNGQREMTTDRNKACMISQNIYRCDYGLFASVGNKNLNKIKLTNHTI